MKSWTPWSSRSGRRSGMRDAGEPQGRVRRNGVPASWSQPNRPGRSLFCLRTRGHARTRHEPGDDCGTPRSTGQYRSGRPRGSTPTALASVGTGDGAGRTEAPGQARTNLPCEISAHRHNRAPLLKSQRRLSGGGEAKHVQTEGTGISRFILFSDIMWLWNDRKYRGPATPSAEPGGARGLETLRRSSQGY